MIQSYQFQWLEQWKHLLILGAIHGNEPCWTMAIEKLIKEINTWKIIIKKGTLTLIPICNPKAFEKKQRFYQENLNRLFHPNNKSTAYEASLATILRTYIDACDYLLDIHSLSWWNDTFLFKSKDHGDEEVDNLAKATLIEQTITGRWDIYQNNNQWCTDDYAHQNGKKWVCIKCGQHNDPHAPVVAYKAIINILKHFNFIDGKAQYKKERVLNIKNIYYKEHEWEFTKKWKHWDTVLQWDIIANYENSKIVAPYDGNILLPKHWAKTGDEWFYFWVPN